MLNKKTLILFLSTAVFVVGVYFLDKNSETSEISNQLNTEQVVQIQIHRSVHPVKDLTLKLNQSWELTEPMEDLADPNKVKEILEALNDVYSEQISLREGDLSFSPPAVLLQTTMANGNLAEFAFALENNYQGKAYVETADIKGKKHIYLVSGDLKKALIQDLNYYREKRILPQGFGLFSHFNFSNLIGRFELQKTLGGWISKPTLFHSDEKFDEHKIKSILKQITEFQITQDVDLKEKSKIDLKSQKISLLFSSEQERWNYEISLDPKTLKVYGWDQVKNRLVVLEPDVWEKIAYLGLDDFRDRSRLLKFNKQDILPNSKLAYNQLVDALHELSIFRFLSEDEKKLMKIESEFTLNKTNKQKMIVYQFGPTVSLMIKGVKEPVTLVHVENESGDHLQKGTVGLRPADVEKIKELLKKVKD